MGYHEHQDCIDPLLKCVAMCNHCASSCLKEEDVKMMAKCIQLDMECAALCYAAAQLMSLGSSYAKHIGHHCAEICMECAEECRKHDNEHCRECAEACRECAQVCVAM